MNSSSEKVVLRISNQRAYVWNVGDIAKIRSQYRICGLLGGTLPHLAQQNVFLGVPLLLMPEEVVLLVDKEAAVIVDDLNAHHPPSQTEKDEWNRLRKIEQSRTITKKEDNKGDVAATKSMTEEAIRKRRKREEQRAAALLKKSSVDDVYVEAAPESPEPHTPVSVSEMTSSHTLIIPTSSTPLSWYHPEAHIFLTLASAREAGVWLYPSSGEERARCGVFRALWEKGFFMGCGIKFGGEFLVYPGDPLRYHSHFVASVLTSPSSPLRPMEVVAHGRLGTATKKAHLLCTWKEESQEAVIFSVEWAGFG